MNKFLSLLKLQINARFGLSMARYNFRHDKKEMWKAIGLASAVLFTLGMFVFFYTYMMLGFHKAASLLPVKSTQIIITMGAASAGLLILFFGIFYILGALFLARDTEFLVSLPIKQSSVFLSKFMLVLLGEYPIALFFMLPPVIIYGTGEQKGVLYYIMALVSVLLLPIVPLVLSSLLSLVLMHVVSRSRRRDLLIIVGSIILFLVLFVGQNLLLSRIPGNLTGMELYTRILQESDGLVEWSGRIFPPAVWITKALSHTGAEALKNLGMLILASAVCFIPVWLLASVIYQKGATAQLEAEKKTINRELTYKGSLPVMVFFKNEWKGILRTPVYALNSLIGIIIGPVILCMPLFGGNFAQDADVEALYAFIRQYRSSPALVLILSGILLLFGSFNAAVSSTYSREGKCLWILKSIPVRPRTQAAGKLLAGYSISLLSVLTASLAMAFTLRLGFGLWLSSFLLSAAAIFPACLIGILIDLNRPKLHWSNPNEAIKQNFNVVLGMLAGMLLIVVLGVVCYGMLRHNMNPALLYGLIILILAGLSLAGLKLLGTTAERAYRKLEG
ncbi:MAG TPA: hypothetical protein PLD49_05280 [Thermoclostridium caenicola]|uniref:putative ABC transporter permease subunit n=1 Tax=Thermoclostridium caenicola TaxID=659425 RepID=UPI002B8605CE|nr:hypothetical protein [Thermoclostridium caenicola]HOK43057.1 hypothetical protein [Thermoclostridium caenicola]HOL83767.1 hypothetical protein [Thermoclostridium caenicola]HPO75985.1 hypothetical protein [Thermoclostridium caenicola]